MLHLTKLRCALRRRQPPSPPRASGLAGGARLPPCGTGAAVRGSRAERRGRATRAPLRGWEEVHRAHRCDGLLQPLDVAVERADWLSFDAAWGAPDPVAEVLDEALQFQLHAPLFDDELLRRHVQEALPTRHIVERQAQALQRLGEPRVARRPGSGACESRRGPWRLLRCEGQAPPLRRLPARPPQRGAALQPRRVAVARRLLGRRARRTADARAGACQPCASVWPRRHVGMNLVRATMYRSSFCRQLPQALLWARSAPRNGRGARRGQTRRRKRFGACLNSLPIFCSAGGRRNAHRCGLLRHMRRRSRWAPGGDRVGDIHGALGSRRSPRVAHARLDVGARGTRFLEQGRPGHLLRASASAESCSAYTSGQAQQQHQRGPQCGGQRPEHLT